MHLWEPEHPYECEPSNYDNYSTELAYPSWSAFYEEWGDSAPEWDLVFRWDWERSGSGVDTLRIFILSQRKGRYMSAAIPVIEADEAAVREWLQVRWEVMRKLWAPLSE